MLYIRRLRIIRKGENAVPNGRPPIISKSIRDILKAEAVVRDRSKQSFTLTTFIERLKVLRLEEAKKLKISQSSIKDLSRMTLQRLMEDVTPESTASGRSQNQRRFEALTDGLNHISLAAMWPAVVNPGKGDEILACRMFNFDATAIMLETSSNSNTTLYMAEGSKEMLKKLGFTPATTASKEEGSYKRRCVSLTALTRADGVLSGVIVKFKDYSFKKTGIYKV